MNFEINGKIKPYVRMTRRGKWVKKNAQEYLASKAAIQHQLKNQMAHNDLDPLPDQTPLSVTLIFYRPAMHICDLDNMIKAALDACQGIVFKDDRWVDMIIARRYVADEHLATLSVGVISQI